MNIFSLSKPKVAIIFDIGSSSVGAAAVLVFPGNKPKVLYSVREEIMIQESFVFERLVFSMIKTLDKVLADISAVKLPPHSGKTFSCFFASPWYASQTMILNKKFDTTVTITEDLLEELQKKEIQGFKEQEIEKIGKDAVIFETKVIQTKLNGYETNNPFGKKAQEIEISIYAGISSARIIKSVTERIKKVFHMSSPKFYSFSLASFTTIRDMFHEKSFLFMDITGETSDLSIVRDDILLETVTFLIGKNTILRKIANDVSSTFQEAVSIFQMAKDDEFKEGGMKKIKKAMMMISKEWITEFQKALSSSSVEQPLSRDLFITADNDVSKWFIENLQDGGADSFSIVGSIFNVRHLNGSFLSSFCDSESKTERDSFLMIESIFLNRMV